MKKRYWLYALLIALFALYLAFANQIISTFAEERFRPDKEVLQAENTSVQYGVDVLMDNDGSFLETVSFEGWTYLPTDHDNSQKQIGLVLFNEKNTYSYTAAPNRTRGDLQSQEKRGTMHGGIFSPSTVLVKDGTYHVGIYCYENASDYGFVKTEYLLTKTGKDIKIEKWHSNLLDLDLNVPVNENARASVDVTETENDRLVIRGWGLLSDQDPAASNTYVVLSYSDGTSEVFDTIVQNRPDLAEAFGAELYANAGFRAEIPMELLHSDKYSVSILIEDENGLHTAPEMLEMVRNSIAAPERVSAEEADSGFSITKIVSVPLTALMMFCYGLLDNYILAIVVFTLLTKLILLPVALWMHRNGIKMVELMPDLNELKIRCFGDKEAIAEGTQDLYKKKGYRPLLSTLPMIIQIVLLMGVVESVKVLLGNSGNWMLLVPFEVGGAALLMPVAAGFAAFLLSLTQCKIAPLQKEQGKAEKLSTGAVSVCISLFLGAFVSLGTGVYWIASNLLSIPIQFLCNLIINPKKYVDYERLHESREKLEEMESLGKKKESYFSENRRREREDYKRFFSIANKHLVFYSEASGFYKYFQNIIEYLLLHSNVIIHYVTSDPNDRIFEMAKQHPRIRAYYIGEKKLITLFMKMDADIVVMTMPDLENFHIKRSYVRKDIEYIYMVHGMTSTNLTVRKGAYDHYNTVFCVGQHQVDEIRETEAMYQLPAKNLVPCGYGLLDNMLKNYAAQSPQPAEEKAKKQILIAPSWQESNILDTCIDGLIEQLYGENYHIVVRPHPEYIKRYPSRMDQLLARYRDRDPEQLYFETDFSSNSTVFSADLLVTDWSSIAHDFAYTTKKPVLFINTPMKIVNPEYAKYKNQPTDITLRDQIGCSLDLDKIGDAGSVVCELFDRREMYAQQISDVVSRYIFNIGESGKIGGKYIISQLITRDRQRNAE